MQNYVTSVFQCSDGALNTSTGDFTALREYAWTDAERRQDYIRMLRKPFQKRCRLRFLNPDGSTAYSLDNNPDNPFSQAFVAEGTLTVNFQNGQRMTAQVTLANAETVLDYRYGGIWYGDEIALDVGLVLSNGDEFYIPKGVFVVNDPEIKVDPATRTMQLNLVDKWANLDGTQRGNLEGTYQVPEDTNIFSPITALLSGNRGNGRIIDRKTPVYTEYFNTKTQRLPDGSIAYLNKTPYTLTVDADNGTEADVVLGLNTMINGLVGYDSVGALRIIPSQDDISDENKPVLWRFGEKEATLLGLTYTVKSSEVYNDYIVLGALLDDNSQMAGRAQNYDDASPTSINLIGRKTVRESRSDFSTAQMCMDYAVWKLKRAAVLQNAVSISCSQIFHIEENNLVTVTRTDKKGSPVERHLVTGYTLPLTDTGNMTITAVSVNDFPRVTTTLWPLTT